MSVPARFINCCSCVPARSLFRGELIFSKTAACSPIMRDWFSLTAGRPLRPRTGLTEQELFETRQERHADYANLHVKSPC